MGANYAVQYISKWGIVSIHAPVMGAKKKALHYLWSDSFNPRTRDGCEPIDTVAQQVIEFQSTHP